MVVPVRAELLLSYEGNAFPEDDDWTAVVLDPLSTRSIQSGIFVTEATVGSDVSFYRRDYMLTSEQVYYEWRSRVSNDLAGAYVDLILQGASVFSQISVGWTDQIATVQVTPDTLASTTETIEIPLQANEFHRFRVESDGADFSVLIDDVPILSSVLQDPNGLNSMIQFGFTPFFGQPSFSEFDYVRIGVIPEPATAALLGLGLLATIRRRCGVVV